MLGDKKIFKSIFQDSTISNNQLVKIVSETYYDGHVLLHNYSISEKNRSDYDWPVSDDKYEMVVGIDLNDAKAIRAAIQFHDGLVSAVDNSALLEMTEPFEE